MKRPSWLLNTPTCTQSSPRAVTWTQEVLFVKSGSVRVDFYTDGQHYSKAGFFQWDVILLAAGGHGFEFLEEAEIIEVKQGPYCDDRDKTRFQAVDSANLNVIRDQPTLNTKSTRQKHDNIASRL